MVNQTVTGTLYNTFTGEPVIPVTDKSINRVTLHIWAPAHEGDCFNKLYIEPETYTIGISIPFYSESFNVSYPGISSAPYCYPCMFYINVYHDYKLDSGDWIRFASPVKNIWIEENCSITQDFNIPIAFPYGPTPTPTATPTATPTVTPSPTPTPEPEIKAYFDCIFPRLLTGEFTPRITTNKPIPRITCLNKVGIPVKASQIPSSVYIDTVPEPGSTKIYYRSSQI